MGKAARALIMGDASIPAGRRLPGLFTCAALALACGAPPASAETIGQSLALAYMGNPDLNVQRAGGRVSDENIARANAGYRPTVGVSANVGFQHTDQQVPISGGSARASNFSVDTVPRGASLTVSQNLFNGFRTDNGLRQAESNVLGSREQIRNTEQGILQNAAQSYMNVLRDTAILSLRKSNITVLEQQLRQTNDRFQVGEVTRTDVAQAEATLAGSRSDFFTAQANLQNSIAGFVQVIGIEPRRLEPAQPLVAGIPRSLPDAIATSLLEHPSIQLALHQVDAAELQVKLVEGELYPSVNVQGGLTQSNDFSTLPGSNQLSASIVGTLTVPIYNGGEIYARARQAKESLGQARLQADSQRNQVRAAVVSSWGLLESSKAVVQSAQTAVNAAEIALNGVREEARVGQRTTLDVLNAQQTLLNTRVQLVSAQRDRVVSTYAILASIGRLSATRLALNVTTYDPTIHFDQVKDKWIGLRTPDGR